MITAFNKWYDGLQEPGRMILAMVLTMSGIIGLCVGNTPVKYAAAIYLMSLVLIRARGR